jgi:hypothetical protein
MIQPTSNSFGYGRTDALAHATPKAAPATPPSSESIDRLTSTSTQAYKAALNETPEIRADVVERARHLAVDPNYPPRELILRLAKMITESVDPADAS